MKFFLSGMDAINSKILSENQMFEHAIMPTPMYCDDLGIFSGFKSVFSDSGAFTILDSKKRCSVDIDSFTDKYIDYINASPKQCMFVELDVENAGYSKQKVDQIYNRLCSTGHHIARVWHRERGLDEFKSYCFKGNFFCLSQPTTFPVDTALRLVYHAYENGAKVHALGLGAPSFWKEVPFYSCDASSWYTGLLAYGRAMIWNEAKCKFDVFAYSSNAEHPTSFAGYGVVTKGKITRKRDKTAFDRNVIFCADQYMKMSKHIENFWKQRGVDFND